MSERGNTVNAALEKHSHSARVDHRSYERQGVERIPTIKMGTAATQMERRGIATDRGNINREIAVTNRQIGQLRARIRKAKTWLYAQPLTDAPSMMDIWDNIAKSKYTDSQWKSLSNLKTKSKVLLFLQKYKVSDMESLAAAVESIQTKFKEVADEIKKVDRRMDTLKTHLAQCENFREYKKYHDKHGKLNGRKADEYFDKHFEQINGFNDAKEYLEAVLNGRKAIPEKTWKAELDKLASARYALCEDYYRLRDDTRSVEQLRKGAENIMREDTGRTQPRRAVDRGR